MEDDFLHQITLNCGVYVSRQGDDEILRVGKIGYGIRIHGTMRACTHVRRDIQTDPFAYLHPFGLIRILDPIHQMPAR